MLSIRFALLIALLVVSLQKHAKSNRQNNNWVASGEHDHTCFTQGLSFINGTHILESCGLYERSFFHILKYTLNNQNETSLTEVYRSKVFDSQFFLEGSIFFPANKIIYILTWNQKVVFRFDSTDYTEILPRIEWTAGEGWGMTHNNTHIFISTGSNNIYVVDEQLNILQTLAIRNERGYPLKNINELEWVLDKGEAYIYANIWQTKDIVKINIDQAKVVARFSHPVLESNSRKYSMGARQDVLNGIAYDAANNVFLLTGKLWPRFYVSFVDNVNL